MKTFILTITILLAALTAAAQVTTRIEGIVLGAGQDCTLLFGDWQQDFRITPAVEIAVKDGRFSFEWTATDTTACQLCFKDEYDAGRWSSYYLFSEGGTLSIEITKGTPRISVGNASMTKRHCDLYQEIFNLHDARLELQKEDRWFSDEARELLRKMDDENLTEVERRELFQKMSALEAGGACYSTEAKAVVERQEEQNRLFNAQCDSVISSTPNVIGLRLLAEKILRAASRNIVREEHEAALQPYLAAMPRHPIVQLVQRKIASIKMRNENLPIPDLTVRRLDGTIHKVRPMISGKYTLLNLWASWCGPCRRHSKELIPVYERFRDRGFSVVAIARESLDTNAMKSAMEQDAYPWTSYVDLGDEFHVWQLMGVDNAGGAIFLLDADGRVIKTNPTAKEVEDFLNENL